MGNRLRAGGDVQTVPGWRAGVLQTGRNVVTLRLVINYTKKFCTCQLAIAPVNCCATCYLATWYRLILHMSPINCPIVTF
jgi:hypothetical protein